MLLEDIHWPTRDRWTVEHLARTAADLRLVIVAASRPSLLERRPAWGTHWRAAHRRLDLEPLGEEETRHLVAEIPAQGAGNPVHVAETWWWSGPKATPSMWKN
jgi:hypothetical protein